MNFYPSFRFVSLAFSVAFLLSGCGGGGGTDVGGDSGGGNGGTTVASDSPPGKIESTDMGDVYATESGMTLYTFNSDALGISNCNGGCANNWPPLLATDQAVAEGRFSVISREGGAKQWAMDGWPLYTWSKDSKPGDATGEEVNSLWYVAQAFAPIMKRSVEVTTDGVTNTVTVLTDTNQKTLYTYSERDNSDEPPCLGGRGDCDTSVWDPLLDENETKPIPDYSLAGRDDGSRQWSYEDMPLFRYTGDGNPGDTSGEGIDDAWSVAQAVPVSKFNTTTQGVVITDPRWLTLYALDNETTDNLVCNAACLEEWPPLIAGRDTNTNRGDYTIFTNAIGLNQWAYKNKPLYFWHDEAKQISVNDVNPDDVSGHGLAHSSGGVWGVVKP